MANHIINPVLSGFYPDPSICVADGCFYLVCSSFSYFPGLPVFRSKNLIKWEQIGNIIERPEQLDFSGQRVSRGLFAPTIRYNNGKYYCICTQVDKIGNFFVTAEKPEGLWSNPVLIEGAGGIDPSLFFDDDGTVWYIGTRPVPEGPKYNGNWEIWINKIDIESGKLIGESQGIWRGALRDCIWPEGPHIYKINGMYYLIHAEGGTGPDHAVCVARCDTINGKWEGKKSNPILTHRHLGKSAGVINVGHADLVKTQDGKWWMCCLASRPYGDDENRFSNMGRETFLVPVKWEDDWPVVSWETGLVENAYSLDGHVAKREADDSNAVEFPVFDDFDAPALEKYWISLRHQNPEFINCTENPGSLRIYGGEPVEELGNVNLVARRQTGFSFEISTHISCHFDSDGDSAGIILFQGEKFNYRLQLKKRENDAALQIVKVAGNEVEILKEESIFEKGKDVSGVLKIVAEHQKLCFMFGRTQSDMKIFAENIDASILSTEVAGGFVGTVAGMFAVSGSDYKEKKFYSDFDWFKYENTEIEWTC